MVSGALDRLHYERDPCVRFDGDRKLWVYLHTEREEEDFEDDGTSSTKRWKKPKKDNADNSEHCTAAYETGSPSGADDPSGAVLWTCTLLMAWADLWTTLQFTQLAEQS